MDLPGHGRSPDRFRPTGDDPRALEVIRAAAASLIDASPHPHLDLILGHSMGAYDGARAVRQGGLDADLLPDALVVGEKQAYPTELRPSMLELARKAERVNIEIAEEPTTPASQHATPENKGIQVAAAEAEWNAYGITWRLVLPIDQKYRSRDRFRLFISRKGQESFRLDVPRIGAGLGGLAWQDVRSVLVALGESTSVELVVFEEYEPSPT